MGYSKDQLDTMFPDRMAFSKFQIDRVKERNDLTQRLMNINGMNGDDMLGGPNGGARIAGEKGREYVLVKNDAVEGGWALGVVSGSNEGERNQPIDVDRLGKTTAVEDGDVEWEDDDGGFEDVPIEGLNRLPKRKHGRNAIDDDLTARRRTLQGSRGQVAQNADQGENEDMSQSNALFVDEDDTAAADDTHNDQVEALFDDGMLSSDDYEGEELNRAIAMSLEVDDREEHDQSPAVARVKDSHSDDDGADSVSEAVREADDTPLVIMRESPTDASDDDMDLQAALAESRRAPGIAKQGSLQELFDGPLPFEKLSIPKSPLMPNEGSPGDDSGGFEKEPAEELEKKSLPLPPWFSGDVQHDLQAQKALEDRQNQEALKRERDNVHQDRILHRREIAEVIDLDPDDKSRISGSNKEIRILLGAKDDDIQLAGLVHQDAIGGITTNSGLVDLTVESSPKLTHQDTNPGTLKDGNHVPTEEVDKLPDEQNPQTVAEALVEAELSREQSPFFEDVLPQEIESLEQNLPRERSASVPSSASSTGAAGTADATGEDQRGNEYSDLEDDQLIEQLAAEAEEHARFASSLNNKSKAQNQDDYERELRALRNQQKKDRRDADEVSHIMITECQQLLTLFGLPYITAPMEAEAQCAELVHLGLVDGIVTDDSDCFLFGGTRIYKNMFNQAKYVECYLANDLEKEFDLDRNKLIRFAHLLGSDYTEGIPGVGPVTALEILSEFNSETGLEDFKEWWRGVQMGLQFPEEAKSGFRKKFVSLPLLFHSLCLLHLSLPVVIFGDLTIEWLSGRKPETKRNTHLPATDFPFHPCHAGLPSSGG